MSILFNVEGRIVKPNVETLLIYPFKEIWERDSTSTKDYAIEDFTYIEFVTSEMKANPFSGYSSTIRKDKVRSAIITREDWEEDELILAGMEEIIKFQREASITYTYYMSARAAAEKMQDFFNDFNMSDVSPKTGMPFYKPKEITSSLIDTSKVLENLNTLREKVNEEVFDEIKNRAKKVISVFANPSSLTDNRT